MTFDAFIALQHARITHKPQVHTSGHKKRTMDHVKYRREVTGLDLVSPYSKAARMWRSKQ